MLKNKRLWLPICAAVLLAIPMAPAGAQDPPQTLQEALRTGSQMRAQGRFAEAAAVYERGLALAENDDERTQALFGLAGSRQAAGELDRALDAYLRLIELPGPLGQRVSAMRQLAALARDMNDLDLARSTHQRILNEYPEQDEVRADALLELARIELQARRPEAALEHLTALNANEQAQWRISEAGILAVRAHLLMEDFPAATQAAVETWQKVPDAPEVMLELATELRGLGRIDEAIEACRKILLARPRDHNGFMVLHHIARSAGRIDDLVRWLQAQSRRDPMEIAWLSYLAQTHEQQQEYAEALEARARMVHLRPTDAGILRDAVSAAVRAEQPERAAPWLADALALEPADLSLYELAGEIHLQRGDLERALESWKRAFSFDPLVSESVMTLARRLQAHDLHDAATELYLEAREAVGDPRAYALPLAESHARRLDFNQAVAEYAKALDDDGMPYSSSTALMRLENLAEDPVSRPPLISALDEFRKQAPLPLPLAVTWAVARVAEGETAQAVYDDLAAVAAARQQAELVLQVASRLESSGRIGPALYFWEKTLQQPHNPDQAAHVAIRVAEAHRLEGRWREALAALEKIVPVGLPPMITGELLVRRADLLVYHARRPDEAQALYLQVLEAKTASPVAQQARWGLAHCAFARGDYDTARQLYGELQAAAAEPNLPGEISYQPYMTPGYGRLSALPALPLPDQSEAQYQKAEMLLREGQFAAATAAFGEVAEHFPSGRRAGAALRRVLLLQRLEPHPQAAATYLQALQAFDRGDGEQARTHLANLSETPLADLALAALSQVALWEGDTAQSTAVRLQLAADHPASELAPEALLHAAVTLLDDDRPQARELLQRLLRDYPQSPQVADAELLLHTTE